MFKVKGLLIAASVAAMLSACYVVPIQPATAGAGPSPRQPSQVVITEVVAPRLVYTARLYPTNDAAAPIGRIVGTISNFEKGRGEFAFDAGKESYTGEATRAPGSSKGNANAVGNKGGYAKCDYSMSSAELGAGTCTFSNGARFDLHISI
ncbi:hypothetical protein [Iodobacter ciconiae]|uniref:Uncharacterized protein n=1 Tax=Iodobacter ciconiae TaxID=2496266 RepID=A0A3S8ZR09_9NEIS|nr:hypothetical protein [Iodobacter ciconiae]AZN35918.1 hypothetical protein EJO50_05130 [Iodobacter ciconiae]